MTRLPSPLSTDCRAAESARARSGSASKRSMAAPEDGQPLARELLEPQHARGLGAGCRG